MLLTKFFPLLHSHGSAVIVDEGVDILGSDGTLRLRVGHGFNTQKGYINLRNNFTLLIVVNFRAEDNFAGGF